MVHHFGKYDAAILCHSLSLPRCLCSNYSLSPKNFSPSVLLILSESHFVPCISYHPNIFRVQKMYRYIICIEIYCDFPSFSSHSPSLSLYVPKLSSIQNSIVLLLPVVARVCMFQWQNDKNKLHSFSSNEFTQSTFITPFTRRTCFV